MGHFCGMFPFRKRRKPRTIFAPIAWIDVICVCEQPPSASAIVLCGFDKTYLDFDVFGAHFLVKIRNLFASIFAAMICPITRLPEGLYMCMVYQNTSRCFRKFHGMSEKISEIQKKNCIVSISASARFFFITTRKSSYYCCSDRLDRTQWYL
jgi:hypothetical protein